MATGLSRKPSRRNHEFSFHLISSSPFGVFLSVSCFSCTWNSDKVPGKLGGASAGDTRCSRITPDWLLQWYSVQRCSHLIVFQKQILHHAPSHCTDSPIRTRFDTRSLQPDFSIRFLLRVFISDFLVSSPQQTSTTAFVFDN